MFQVQWKTILLGFGRNLAQSTTPLFAYLLLNIIELHNDFLSCTKNLTLHGCIKVAYLQYNVEDDHFGPATNAPCQSYCKKLNEFQPLISLDLCKAKYCVSFTIVFVLLVSKSVDNLK